MIVAKTNLTEFPECCYKCKYAYVFDISTKYCVITGKTIPSKGAVRRINDCTLMEVEDEQNQ